MHYYRGGVLEEGKHSGKCGDKYDEKRLFNCGCLNYQ